MYTSNDKDDLLVSGTSEKDDIYNRGHNVTINGGDGHDKISNRDEGKNVIINGENGDDHITVYGRNVTVNSGNGDDDIYNSAYNANINGGNGDDSIYSSKEYATIYAGDGSDTIQNWAEHALIYCGDGNDSVDNRSIGKHSTIVGGAGDDTINWYTYNNTSVLQYAEGDGNDVVVDSAGFGTPVMNLSIVKGSYTVNDDGNDLLVRVGNGSIRFVGMAGKTININENPEAGTTNPTSPVTLTTTTQTTPATTTTKTTSTPATTTTSTPSVTSGTGGGDTIINNYYYGDYYDNSNNNGTIINNSSVGGDVTNVTDVDNSTTIVISGNTWTYNGGNKIINNYQQGEVVELASDYQGIDLKENSFYVKSSSGQLEIQNSRDKFVGYSASGQMAAYSYVASGAGNVDGRAYDKAEIMIGADNANNQIYAGNAGSSLWGGNGGTDTLTGGNGYDEFFYAVGGGDDVIQNANDNDLINLASVNLSQIAGVDVNIGEVTINFVDGGNLRVQGDSSVGYQIAEGTFQVNQSTGQWSDKN